MRYSTTRTKGEEEEKEEGPMKATGKRYPMKSDIRERDDRFVLEIDLPGFDKENIKAYIQNGYLIVSALRERGKEKENHKWIRQERYYGNYQRSFYIGTDISEEDLKATYRFGVLKIQIPKKAKKTEQHEGNIQIA